MTTRRLSTLAVGAAVLTGSLFTLPTAASAAGTMAAPPATAVRSFGPTLGLAPAALDRKSTRLNSSH